MAQKTLTPTTPQRISGKPKKVSPGADDVTALAVDIPRQTAQTAQTATNDLTFITSEGERITFPEMEMPIGDATAIASEEAMGKIWNRPSEDLAWRDM